jgi:hypothetical protein
MRYLSAAFLTVALLGANSVVRVASASAASYDVVQCGLGNTPAPDAASYETGTTLFNFTGDCASAGHLQVIGDGSGATIPDGATGNWNWNAPPGTGFSAVSVSANLRNKDSQFARLIATNANGADLVAFGTGSSNSVQQTYTWSRGTGPTRSQFRGSLTCSQAGGCANPSSGRAFIQMQDVRLTVEDSESPDVSASGSLLASGTRSGNQSLTLTATDQGGGVRQTTVTVNGTVVTPKTESCQLVNSTTAQRLTPCPTSVTETNSYDTTRGPWLRGHNSVVVCAEDFDQGGNGNDGCTTPYDVVVDNNAPQTTVGSGPSGATGYGDASFSFSTDQWGTRFECRLDGAAWAPCASPKAYSQLANGSHTFDVRAIDQYGTADATPASRSWTVNTNAITGPTDTKILGAPPSMTDSSSASFSFSSNKPLAKFACQLDGSGFSSCNSPKGFSGLADGRHTFQVRATDLIGTVDATPAERTWTIDHDPPIYHAQEYDGNPADGGELVSEEWGRLGTQTGRHEDADTIATRETVNCQDPNTGQCDETRVISALGNQDPRTDPQAPVAYDVTLGSSRTDPELDQVIGILEPATITDPPTDTGPISDAVSSWQTLPPGHSTRYELYTGTGTNEDGSAIGGQLWVDEATKMPLKQTTSSSGGPNGTSYWTYDGEPTAGSDLPQGFLDLPQPVNILGETNVQAVGGADLGQVTDAETGTTFTPYYLGLTPSLPGSSYCLSTIDIVHFNSYEPQPTNDQDPELPPADAPDPFETMTDAVYSASAPGEPCTPGRVLPDTPPLEVLSYAGASTSGQGWTDTYSTAASAMDQDSTDPDSILGGLVSVSVGGPTVASVLPRDGGASTDSSSTALLNLGNTTVVVQGDFAKSAVPLVAADLVAR